MHTCPSTTHQPHTQHVQRAGLNPLVCLTHVDLAYPILRQDPNVRARVLLLCILLRDHGVRLVLRQKRGRISK